mmetsp:Transcript_32623/g.5912  ORF Transcript_32623/g.5912 Transcript_32623/m.5912 type:complete len:95 (+) Transcript_32623:865-1149(+)
MLLIIIFGISILGRCSPVYCRIPLGIALLISYTMTMYMSLAFPNYVGYDFNSASAPLSFMLVLQVFVYCGYLIRSTESADIRPDETLNYNEKFT